MTIPELRHRLAAILVADVAGYSRLMTGDQLATLTALDAARTVFQQRLNLGPRTINRREPHTKILLLRVKV